MPVFFVLFFLPTVASISWSRWFLVILVDQWRAVICADRFLQVNLFNLAQAQRSICFSFLGGKLSSCTRWGFLGIWVGIGRWFFRDSSSILLRSPLQVLEASRFNLVQISLVPGAALFSVLAFVGLLYSIPEQISTAACLPLVGCSPSQSPATSASAPGVLAL